MTRNRMVVMVEQLVPMMLVLVVFYFVLIRPQMKEKEAHDQMLASIAKDDLVVSAGGIHGRVESVADHTLVVEIAKGTRITLDRASVARKIGKEGAASAARTA